MRVHGRRSHVRYTQVVAGRDDEVVHADDAKSERAHEDYAREETPAGHPFIVTRFRGQRPAGTSACRAP